MGTIRTSFFDSSRDVATATGFMAKFRYMRSFGRAAVKTACSRAYRHSDSNILKGNIIIRYILCKYDENRCNNPRDYEDNKWTCLDETAKIGLSRQISHQLLDQPW